MMITNRVVADERERASTVPEELSKLNIRVYFSKLNIGDYVLSPEVAVERKSLSDLISSIYDSRIFYQASLLSSTYAKPYLLVEGDSKEVQNLTSNIKSYYGAIASVTLAYGLRVLYTANPRESAIAIAELLKHVKSRPTQPLPRLPKKEGSVAEKQLYLIASLPGIGRKLAERLLIKHGTPRKVMNLTLAEFSMVPGIGWRRAERIVELLDQRYLAYKKGEEQMRLG